MPADAVKTTRVARPDERAQSRRLRPGSGAVLYLVVVSLVATATLHTQANLLYWSLGLLLGGLVVSLLWAWLSLWGVQVRRLSVGYAVEGERLVLRYQVTNRSWLPVFGLVVQEHGSGGRSSVLRRGLSGVPVGWLAHLGVGAGGQVEAVCWPTRRGELVLESIELSTSFPFSMLKRVVRLAAPQSVVVFPRLMRLQPRVIHASQQSSAGVGMHMDQPGGQDEFYGLRDYRVGDALRQIDWKRTARSGRMITRELTRSAPPRIMVLLDLSDPPWQRLEGRSAEQLEEDAICLCASLICEAYTKGYQVGLAVSGPACGLFLPHHTLPHRIKMLESLSRLDLSVRGHRPQVTGISPTVIVWAGESTGTGLGQRVGGTAQVLGALDMAGYTSGEAMDGSSAIGTLSTGLNRSARPARLGGPSAGWRSGRPGA